MLQLLLTSDQQWPILGEETVPGTTEESLKDVTLVATQANNLSDPACCNEKVDYIRRLSPCKV